MYNMPFKDKDKELKYRKKYYQDNKDNIKKRVSKYYKDNRNKRIKKVNEYYYKIVRPKTLTGEGSGHGRGKKFKKGNIPWNKGLDNYSENHKLRSSNDYRIWRKQCLKRDNFTCRLSGINGGKLVVHHINNFADFPELRFSLDNGITMTKELHKLFHKLYGKRNNTINQLIEFKEDLFFNPSNDYIVHV